MDFGSILQTAKGNDQAKKEVRYYSTKFSPPKKEEKKAKNLSVNIQKFLARKEEEERQKTTEANKIRHDLLALRSKDKKATRRVNVMLKRTKSANQSVIEDAVDNVNTAVTLTGPSQPDEDDYGYVSQEAAAYYNKMMEKYSKIPEDPKFPVSKKKASNNLSNTKDRVKAALEKEKEDAMLPHRRKRKHKEPTDEEASDERCDEIRSESPVKSKPKVAPRPSMNFTDLLKLAAQKQHEPIVIEAKPKDDDGPLMTKKQKREFERIQQSKTGKVSTKPTLEQGDTSRIGKLEASSPSNANTKQKETVPNFKSKPVKAVKHINGILSRIESLKVPESRGENLIKKPLKTQESNLKLQSSSKGNDQRNIVSEGTKKLVNNKPLPVQNNPRPVTTNSNKNLGSLKNAIGSSVPRSAPKLSPITAKKDVPLSNQHKGNVRPRLENRESDMQGKNMQTKRFPPEDLRTNQLKNQNVHKPFKMDERQQLMKNVKSKPQIGNKRRIIDDDDEDYDSEMDDFIDDGPEEMEDYSKYIKDIFGYDKRKYKGLDEDDVDNMESTFAQQMREDIRSTKLGIMEDLEDIQREKDEKKRKAVLKKKKP